MRAASRAAAALLVAALGLVGFIAPSARAQPTAPTTAGPTCPAVVGGQPLSVDVAFSGVVRPATDDGGTVVGGDLLCAYGDGARPGAEIRVSWRTGAAGCSTADTAVAEGLDAAAFRSAADALTGLLGPACAPEAGLSTPALLGGAVLGAVMALGTVWAWRRRRRSARATPETVRPDGAEAADTAVAPPAPVPRDTAPADEGPRPDLAPVLAALRGPGGVHLSGRAAGQLAVAAAMAYRQGTPVPGDLARAAVLQVDRVNRPARGDLAEWCERLAHEPTGAGR